MSKSTKGARAAGGVLGSTTPTGKNPTGKAQAQDIELNPKSTPAGGKGPGVGSQAVPLNKQIDALLTKNGVLIDKSPEAVQKLTQIIGRWEVNETTRLSDLGGKETQKRILKYLKNSGNQEMYVSALAKHDPSQGKLPTTALQKEYDTLIRGNQGKQPNESRPKVNNETVNHRPEKRPNRKYEETTGNMDPNLPAYENLQKIGQRMDGDAAADDDYIYALEQGYGPNKFDGELARIQSMTDPVERAEAISALAVNATKAMGRSNDLSTTGKFEQWLEQHLVKIDKPKTSGGGVKIGDGPLPGEKQRSLDFDGGGDTAKAGPETVLNTDPKIKDERLRKINPNAKPTYDALETDAEKLAYLKTKRGDDGVNGYKPEDGNLVGWELQEYKRLTGTQTNRAANATGTENVPPEAKEPFEAQTVPPAGDVGDSELQGLKNWAINSIRQEVELRMGGSVDSNPAIQKKYDDLVNEFLKGIEGDPDAVAKLQKLKEGSQPASTEAPQPQPNRQTPNQAASSGNQTRNTTQPVQPGTTPTSGGSGKGSQFQPSGAPKGMAPSGKPQTVPPGTGKGGSTKGWDPVAEAKKFDNDPMRAEELRLAKEEAAINAKMAKADARKPYKYAAAAGVAGSLAWAWLNSGDDEPEGQVSTPVASITGDPSTSTGSASGSVADGSGGSAGGMSQEQMENMMKLQQIRDEQKRRFIGTGSGAQGVYR
jgi:hypothetical protein